MKKAEQALLHIGQPKTGTTTLQIAMMQAQDYLREHGVMFPARHFGRSNAVLLGYYLFGFRDADGTRQRWLKMDLPELQDAAKQAWQNIKDDVAAKPPETLLISSEIFFRPMSARRLAFVAENFADVADTTQIIAYLRAPDTMFLSSTQELLKHFIPLQRPSRTHLRDCLEPYLTHWKGQVSLNVFDKRVMKDGDVLSDFTSKYLPDIDHGKIRPDKGEMNTTISSEAMAILHEFQSRRRHWSGDWFKLADEIRKADRRIPDPTKPKARPGVFQYVNNWQAPDLFWLRDTVGITFPGLDYDALDPNDIDDAVLRIGRIEDICDVNPDRKAAVLRRAMLRAKLPKPMRRWLARF